MGNRSEPRADRAVWKAAQEIAEAVAGSSTSRELGQQVMQAIDGMVECDFGSILAAAPGQQWSIRGEKEDNQIIRRNHWRYAQEMSAAELQRMATRFTPDTEIFFQAKRRERMSVYQDFIRPNRQAGFIARYWVMDGKLWGIGMSRGRPSFTDRERERLDALFPQVRAALRAGTWLGGEDGSPWSLTPAEERTMALVTRGLTNSEVADLLGNSPNTVRNTLAQIFKKVGVSRRSELAFVVGAWRNDPASASDRRTVAYRDHHAAVEAVGKVRKAPTRRG